VTATAPAPHTGNDCETWRQAREGPVGLQRPPYQAGTAPEPGDPASDLDTAEPQWAPEGPGWQDVAFPLRLLLSRGTWLAIATVVGARGPVVRQPGTVLVLTEAGQTIGFNPAGPLDGTIRDLAAEALATGAGPPGVPADRGGRSSLHRPALRASVQEGSPCRLRR
jgi:hypothetical protein